VAKKPKVKVTGHTALRDKITDKQMVMQSTNLMANIAHIKHNKVGFHLTGVTPG